MSLKLTIKVVAFFLGHPVLVTRYVAQLIHSIWISKKSGADPGFSFRGGGGRKRLCARTHITNAEPNSLSAGVRARLRDPEALGCNLSLIFKHSDKKLDKKHSWSIGLRPPPPGSATESMNSNISAPFFRDTYHFLDPCNSVFIISLLSMNCLRTYSLAMHEYEILWDNDCLIYPYFISRVMAGAWEFRD